MSALGEVFRFEVEYRLRRVSTWIYGGLLLLVPFLLLHAVNGAGGYLNSPEGVATATSVVGMLGMLVTAALFGDAATRDLQTGMHPLMFSTPIRRADYLGGRFLGALLVNAVLLFGVPLGQIIAAAMPYMDPRMFGPFRLDGYVQAYVLLLLPNLLLTAAILFTLASLRRQMLPAFLGGIGLFIIYVVSSVVRANIADPTLRLLSDPFGMLVIEDYTQYWTPVQRNTEAIGFPSMLIVNRLFWMALAALLLLFLFRRFRFANSATAQRRRSRRAVSDPQPARTRPVAVPIVPTAFSAGARVHQTLAVLRRSLEDIVANRAFFILLAGAVALTFMVGWNLGSQAVGTATWPVTHLVAVTVLGAAVSPVVVILIAVFAGELVWKEREVRLSAISDAAPVPDWVLMLGRFLALVIMLIALLTVLMLSGMVLQAIQGWQHFEPALYLRILFGIRLPDFILIAALAMAVHVIVNQKYLAHLLVVLVYLFTTLATQFGIQHRLLIYGTGPGWMYSDMNGFGPFTASIVWFRLYWAAWALLLAFIARVFWVRGRDREVRGAFAIARARLTGPLMRAGGLAALLVIALGGFIFYNTNVLNEYRTPSEQDALLAKYERTYKRHANVPQPRITRAELRVELYPDASAADLRGTFTLLNDRPQAIDSVHISLVPDVEARSLEFDRPAQRVLHDAELDYDIYRLEQPLQPGDSIRLSFDLGFRKRGFRNSGEPTGMVENGAHFDRSWLPFIGYRGSRELVDAAAREKQGLPPRAAPASPYDAAAALSASSVMRGVEPVLVDAIIGTDTTQIAITVGKLVREWRENGRRYFHYRTEPPLPFGSPFLSGRYAVGEDRWGEVPLRVYYHPTHGVNLDRILRGMKASLDYYTREFGPYPFDDLRIVEFPLYGTFNRAHPHTIVFSEAGAFLSRINPGDVDRTFFVTAHEIAHQWWGGLVRAAPLRGNNFVSETLAQYSAMMVMESELGADQARGFYDFQMSQYLTGRTVFTNREAPLLEVENQNYVYYPKGAIAMYTLREHIGAEQVNLALRRFLAKFGGGGEPPFPTSLDLYAEFRAVTPDSLHGLLHDLFAEITLWDVKADSAAVQPTDDGQFRVTLDVTARKLRADSIGIETEVSMNDLVEVGIFGEGAPGSPGAPLYSQRHRLRSGQQTITVVVPQRPASAGIDPLGKLIQREAGDNVVKVK